MATLLESLKKSRTSTTEDATRRYRELVKRNDENGHEQMHRALGELGLGVEDVERDLATLRKADELRGQVLSAERIKAMTAEQERTSAEADKRFRAVLKEHVDRIPQPDLHHIALVIQAATKWDYSEAESAFIAGVQHSRMNLQNAVNAGHTAAHELQQLDAANPRLFGGE